MKLITMTLILFLAGTVHAAKSKSKSKGSSTRASRAAKVDIGDMGPSCSIPGAENGGLPSSVESNLGAMAMRARAMGVSAAAVNNAFQYYRSNYSKIRNKCYLTIVDFNKSAAQERFFIFNMKNGSIESLKTSHGRNSEKIAGRVTTRRGKKGRRVAVRSGVRTFQAERFSNQMGSNASSLGIYETLGTYDGKHGFSLKLNGKDATNSNALARAIVIHQANYVSGGGRSEGCFALEPSKYRRVINQLKGGSVIYAYHNQLGGSSALPVAKVTPIKPEGLTGAQ